MFLSLFSLRPFLLFCWLFSSCAFFEPFNESIDLSRVLKIDLQSAAKSKSYQTSMVKIGDELYSVDSKQRGAVSFNYPKKSYTLRFSKQSFASLKRRFPNTFGKLSNDGNLVLTSNFDDTSYIRSRLAFTLWGWFDAKNHLKIETFFVELFLQGHFHGLYTAIDHVNESLLASQGLNPFKGTLFKIIGHQGADGDEINEIRTSMEIKSSGLKNPIGGFDEMIKLMDLFIRPSKEAFSHHFEKVARRADFEDWWVFASLIHASDSAWKNAYLYHEKGGKWRYLPWDFNASFGQSFGGPAKGNLTSSRPDNLPRLFADKNLFFKVFLDNPITRDRLYQRARELIKNEWELVKIQNQIDRWVFEIEDLAKKDEEKWQQHLQQYFNVTQAQAQARNFENEIQWIKTWIKERWQHAQTQLN